jgi:hypothetical protein
MELAMFSEHKCPDCGKLYEGNGVTICEDNAKRTICPVCAELKGLSQCAGCDGWVHWDELAEGADDENYCLDCWNDRFSYCDGCNGIFYRDNVYYDERSDCQYCESCTPSRDEFEPASFNGQHTYTRMPSRRKFGVELETDDCDGYRELDDSFWGAKPDCSVRGMEFYSAVLYGNAGLEACDDICQFADRNGWQVDKRCGYHAHFDMSEESDDSLKAIACAYLLTYDVWKAFVNSSRIEHRYCHSNPASISELYSTPEFKDFSWKHTRYAWINFCAYNIHSTFEVRLHEGTLDKYAITNWIRGHATFMDWASEAGWAKVRNTFIAMNSNEKFEFIAQVWARAGCADLGEYYGQRARSNNAVWAACEVC